MKCVENGSSYGLLRPQPAHRFSGKPKSGVDRPLAKATRLRLLLSPGWQAR
jgi:hypothetical protein